MKSILSMKFLMVLFLCFALLAIDALEPVWASQQHSQSEESEHDHDSSQHEHKTEEESVIAMSEAMVQANGIITRQAEGGILRQTTKLYGRLVTDPASLSHVRARFDGMIIEANANIGMRVKKGSVLATIESNESLKRYTIAAPFDGEVIARHANAGELSNGQVLFSIANYERVWAELALFPSQIDTIKTGQDVTLFYADATQQSSISHITATAENVTHSAVFVSVNNANARWPVGTLVEGLVTTSEFDVDLLIPRSALQRFENETVVFVREGGEFHAEPVEVGRMDEVNVEILGGISHGDLIVVENSFLLKADLQKSEAGHDH
ncbi:efflux RND transporter periplasmic adaptor subunit [Aestuariibacter sp. AA17]|uniref:Efflux RND transporter periplasmic adaptor subunit n=1 Tax=Fluctibacter corallii TaxID=2984329 RepID=A0ABT3A6G3_9ALTE|nr:efflux RND transporter periplasmic adaptor subunit [Aestuariibacter sp. AA17]MCV2884188.1 efflux RND transporter periplasmic adaptor subunit [Aestuariibacter sp. AA17]